MGDDPPGFLVTLRDRSLSRITIRLLRVAGLTVLLRRPALLSIALLSISLGAILLLASLLVRVAILRIALLVTSLLIRITVLIPGLLVTRIRVAITLLRITLRRLLTVWRWHRLRRLLTVRHTGRRIAVALLGRRRRVRIR